MSGGRWCASPDNGTERTAKWFTVVCLFLNSSDRINLRTQFRQLIDEPG